MTDHTFDMSMSALEAGVVMMMCCHHLSLTMMQSRLIGIPSLEPSLADEAAMQISGIDITLFIWREQKKEHFTDDCV